MEIMQIVILCFMHVVKKKKYPIEFSSFNTESYNINCTRKAKDLEEKSSYLQYLTKRGWREKQGNKISF